MFKEIIEVKSPKFPKNKEARIFFKENENKHSKKSSQKKYILCMNNKNISKEKKKISEKNNSISKNKKKFNFFENWGFQSSQDQNLLKENLEKNPINQDTKKDYNFFDEIEKIDENVEGKKKQNNHNIIKEQLKKLDIKKNNNKKFSNFSSNKKKIEKLKIDKNSSKADINEYFLQLYENKETFSSFESDDSLKEHLFKKNKLNKKKNFEKEVIEIKSLNKTNSKKKDKKKTIIIESDKFDIFNVNSDKISKVKKCNNNVISKSLNNLNQKIIKNLEMSNIIEIIDLTENKKEKNIKIINLVDDIESNNFKNKSNFRNCNLLIKNDNNKKDSFTKKDLNEKKKIEFIENNDKNEISKNFLINKDKIKIINSKIKNKGYNIQKPFVQKFSNNLNINNLNNVDHENVNNKSFNNIDNINNNSYSKDKIFQNKKIKQNLKEKICNGNKKEKEDLKNHNRENHIREFFKMSKKEFYKTDFKNVKEKNKNIKKINNNNFLSIKEKYDSLKKTKNNGINKMMEETNFCFKDIKLNDEENKEFFEIYKKNDFDINNIILTHNKLKEFFDYYQYFN